MISVEIVVAFVTVAGSPPCALASGYSELASVIPIDEALVNTLSEGSEKYAGPVRVGDSCLGVRLALDEACASPTFAGCYLKPCQWRLCCGRWRRWGSPLSGG